MYLYIYMHITLHYNTISTFIYVYIHIYLRGQSPGIYIYAYIHSKDKVLVYRYIYITPRTKSWTTKKQRPCSGHCLSGRLVTVSMYLYIYIYIEIHMICICIYLQGQSPGIYIYAYIHSKDKVLV